MYRLSLVIMSFITLVLLGAGCSKSPAETDDTSTSLNLTDEYGGYTATAEKVAFDDPDLIAETELNEGEEYNDPILLSPVVASLVDDSERNFYHLRALWGQLRCDTSVTNVTDWSGSLTISDGAAIIRRTIHFELGQDYIPTRTDRTLIEWVSYTTIHNDGIAVDFYIPDSVDAETVTIDFSTGPYSRIFSLEELTSLYTIVYLDNADSNAIALFGFQLNHAFCPRGHLLGGWGYNEEGDGVFRGTWMSRSGWVAGYLQGHFGIDDDGVQVFFGKWINRSGEFEGYLRGIYGHNGNGDGFGNGNGNGNGDDNRTDSAQGRYCGGGWYAGDILNANDHEIGVMRGRFRSASDRAHGFFAGRWKVRCSAIAAELDDSAEGF